MEKSAQRVAKRTKIVESYFVEKEVFYPSDPERVNKALQMTPGIVANFNVVLPVTFRCQRQVRSPQ